MAHIDRIFRSYGEKFFGTETMNKLSDEQVEEARCYAFKELNKLTIAFGKQPKGIVEELFYNYIIVTFL